MNQVTGTVEEVKWGKVLRVSGQDYSAFSADQLSGAGVGDQVQFNYKVNAKGDRVYYNIEKNVVVTARGSGNSNVSNFPKQSSSSGARGTPDPFLLTELPEHYGTTKGYLNLLKTFPVAKNHPDRSIIRQNCVGNATTLVSSFDDGMGSAEAADMTIKVAKILEGYSSGEMDDAEAAEALAELGKS